MRLNFFSVKIHFFNITLFSADAEILQQHSHSTMIAISFLTTPFVVLLIAICWLVIDWPGLFKHIIRGRHVEKRKTHLQSKIVFNSYCA